MEGAGGRKLVGGEPGMDDGGGGGGGGAEGGGGAQDDRGGGDNDAPCQHGRSTPCHSRGNACRQRQHTTPTRPPHGRDSPSLSGTPIARHPRANARHTDTGGSRPDCSVNSAHRRPRRDGKATTAVVGCRSRGADAQ